MSTVRDRHSFPFLLRGVVNVDRTVRTVPRNVTETFGKHYTEYTTDPQMLQG